MVDWSFEQLSSMDRAIFSRLAVLAGDFTLDAAEFVAAGDGVPADYVMDGLSRLVDKSLVELKVGDEGAHYRLLDTLRSYGRARLEDAGKLSAAQERYLEWALSITAQLEQDMRTERQDASLASIVPHRANLRAAIELCRARGQDLEALRIVASAPVDTPGERMRLIEILLPAVGGGNDDVEGRAHLAAANLEFERGRFAEGADHARSARRIFAAKGDFRSVAWSDFLETFGSWGAGDTDRARAACTAAREQFEKLGDRVGFANASWAAIALESDPAAGDRLGEHAEAELRSIGSPFALAHCLEVRSLVALRLGQSEAARPRLAEALYVFSSTGNAGCAAHSLEAIAAIVLATDSSAEICGVAAELLGAAEGLRTSSGHKHRPWELDGQRAALTILRDAIAPDGLGAAIQRGHSHTLRSATQLAQHVLARVGG